MDFNENNLVLNMMISQDLHFLYFFKFRALEPLWDPIFLLHDERMDFYEKCNESFMKLQRPNRNIKFRFGVHVCSIWEPSNENFYF